jgi:hypothetical protein
MAAISLLFIPELNLRAMMSLALSSRPAMAANSRAFSSLRSSAASSLGSPETGSGLSSSETSPLRLRALAQSITALRAIPNSQACSGPFAPS